MIEFFLPGIIALGLITSYEDIKYGKIRNKWVIFALIYALVANFIIIAFFSITTGINTHYIIEFFTNFLFSILIGFGAWYFKLWTAGDGKLFIAFSALVPLSIYEFGYIEWTPSFTLLMNIFIFALIIMIFYLLYKSSLKDIKEASIGFFKDVFNIKKLFTTIVSLFIIYWFIEILLSLFKIKNFFLVILTTILAYNYIKKKTKKGFIFFAIAISLLRLVIDKSVYSSTFLIIFLILIIAWEIIDSFLNHAISKLISKVFSKEIEVNKLKPGMVLSELIKKEGDKYSKNVKSAFYADNFLDEESEGLTQKQIEKISNTGIKKLRVSQMIPFAPFILVGVILTLIAKGNILIFILKIL
ncbi:MAG: hypothetical protein QF917_00245 [Candidatus Woesearchaeota archaeon]|jgi:hypothetical protein|nr:hypothetical protein [Candidatus Woesearchaeota archaeon]